MSISRTPSGKYYFRFQKHHQSFCEGGFRTWEQARQAEVKALNRAIQDEINPAAKTNDMTFAEAGKLFFENHAKKYKRSWKNDRARIGMIAKFFGEKPLKKISSQDVEELLNWLQRKRGISDHTRNHYLAMVKLIFNRLRKWRIFSGENPACFVEMKKVARARVRFLFPSEERMVTPAVVQDRVVWPYYFVALHTGMRIGEIAKMRVKDISLPLRQIFIPDSKSSRSRHIPVSEELVRFLEPILTAKGPEDYALAGVIRDYVSRRFRSICRTIGLVDFKFHDLRHTFAAHLLTKGVPIYKVSKILGHSSVVVTEQHYGHLSMADLKDAVDQIDGVVGAAGCNGIVMAQTIAAA
jgi:integrase